MILTLIHCAWRDALTAPQETEQVPVKEENDEELDAEMVCRACLDYWQL